MTQKQTKMRKPMHVKTNVKAGGWRCDRRTGGAVWSDYGGADERSDLRCPRGVVTANYS